MSEAYEFKASIFNIKQSLASRPFWVQNCFRIIDSAAFEYMLTSTFSNDQISVYHGISPQVSSIEYDLIDSAENCIYGVVFDADHESGLRFLNFETLHELWPKNCFSPS